MKNQLQQLARRFRSTADKGSHFEKIARTYLTRKGFRKFRHNFRSRFGEIDLIAEDKGTLVFIEVRYRQDLSHGSPLATVNKGKQEKIIMTARYFLQKNGLTNRMPCRFDVIGITGPSDKIQIHWIKNAF
jgi:putative endonuclease